MTFDELDITATSLMDDDFSTLNSLKVMTKNKNGGKIDFSTKLTGDGNTDTELGLSAAPSSSGGLIAFPCTLEKLRFRADGHVTLESSLALSESLLFRFNAADGRQEPGKQLHSYGAIGLESKSTHVKTSCMLDLVNGPLLNLRSIFQVDNFAIGGNLLYNTKLDSGYESSTPSILDIGLSARYKGNDWESAVRTMNGMSALRGTYVQKVSDETRIAAIVDYSLDTNEQKMAIATEWQLDNITQVKAKVDSAGSLNFSCKQTVTDKLSATVAAHTNARDVDNQSPASMGISLVFDL